MCRRKCQSENSNLHAVQNFRGRFVADAILSHIYREARKQINFAQNKDVSF